MSTVEQLTDQCQRDAELAAEWKAASETYRVDAETQRDRADALHQERNDACQVIIAAKARIAELEHTVGAAGKMIDANVEAIDAATARAEAAERAHEETKHDANAAWCIEVQMRQRAESEAATLRAEVERLRNDSALRSVEFIGKHNDLAAATALLERCRMSIGGELGADIRAMLASTLAPSERAAAERAVLDACAALVDSLDSRLPVSAEIGIARCGVEVPVLMAVRAAELARRAVTK